MHNGGTELGLGLVHPSCFWFDSKFLLQETPDTVVEPFFCGSYTESEPTCMMHHQRPKKMVAFEGALTGRRFLGCPMQQVFNLER